MQDSPELRQGLLAADHGTEREQQPEAAAAAAPADAPAAGTAAAPPPASDGSPEEEGADEEAGGGPLVRERSLLSRAGSLTGMPRVVPLPPPPSRLRRFRFCAKASAWFTGTLLLGVLAVIGLVVFAFPLPSEGGLPACRSGAALAVLPPEAGSNSSQRLVVWSGQGQSGALLRGMHTFSLTDLSWSKVRDRERQNKDGSAAVQQQHHHQQQQPFLEQQQPSLQQPQPVEHWQGRKPTPPPPPQPAARRQAGVAFVEGLGMVVHGGDAADSAKGKGQQPASSPVNDTWLLHAPSLHWQQGCACDSSGNCSAAVAGKAPAPKARRAPTLVSYQDAAGRRMLLLFGGRRADGLLLNDVWSGEIVQLTGEGPPSCRFGVKWTLLHDPQSGVGTGPAPLPRRGHVAVMQNGSRMIVHGGRSEVYGSFSDVWAFSLDTSRWQPLTPSTLVQPAPRDHHGAALWGGRLLVFGGRFGTQTEAYRPIGDRWLFDLERKTWTQLPIRGLSPLPRFQFASTQYTPADSGADRLLVFGGQTGSGCKLNDVWQLNLETHRWEQLSTPMFATVECRRLFG